ncbi:hypothetical protein ACTXT7_007341 [Hymenolepis weldensis]
MPDKPLLKKLKHPEEQECPSFFFDGLRVNADADAYVVTLQAIVVKPLWIDSVANGARPYVFLQDSAPSHNALKIQDWMAENFILRVSSLSLKELKGRSQYILQPIETDCHVLYKASLHRDCKDPIDPGRGRACFQRYAYDQSTERCRQFIWGGCDANHNNFETLEECQDKCEHERSHCAVF